MIYYTCNSSSLRLQGKLPRTSKHPVHDGPTPDFPFPILEPNLISRPAEEHPLSTPALDAQIIPLHLHPLQLQPSLPPSSSAFFLTCALAVALEFHPNSLLTLPLPRSPRTSSLLNSKDSLQFLTFDHSHLLEILMDVLLHLLTTSSPLWTPLLFATS